jgi:SNF2 family DNA or RNA helicase
MVAGVYGERSADGSHIVIMAAGDDWELDRAAGVLKRMTPLLRKTDPPGALAMPCTWAAVTQLGHSFTGEYTGVWCPGPRLQEWIVEEFTRRHAPGDLHYWPGDQLTPRPYQVDGACQIAASDGFLLFDDPGTGKTVTTVLGLLEREKRGGAVFPMVIVVPSWDVADVWATHIRQWAPGWGEPVLYAGPARGLLSDDRIAITTYATARIDADFLAKLKPAVVIADEVHLIKNQDSQQSKAVRAIARHAMFLGLSGTPITRDTGDLYPCLAAMDAQSYPSRKRFVQRYCDTIEDEYSVKVQGLNAAAEPEFRCALAGQHRRVAKADVLAQLPPKIYSVRRVEVPPEWRKAYDGMADEMLAELPVNDEGVGQELPVMSVLAQLTRLSQLASSAVDVITRVEEPDTAAGYPAMRTAYDITLRAPSWKADALLEILAERPGQQVAVFANSRQLIEIAGQACEQAGYRIGFITGTISATARQTFIKAFQAGRLDVILCTAGAGSLGITLTAAGTAVFLQRSWEFDKAVQPEDRLHRIGQQNSVVEIIDIVAKDTVDDRVRELLHVKGGHLGQLVQDPRIVRELLGGIK